MERRAEKGSQVIRIQNIYYMLAYAFQILNERGYRRVAAEHFENTAELCSAILARGISTQVKRGLVKQYIPETDALNTLRGRIDISESIRMLTFRQKKMFCSWDEFSVNAYMNRIIKSTVFLLLKSDISEARKKELKKLMLYFADVEPLDISKINWKMQYCRNNQSYRMLISICYLIVKGLLQTRSGGTIKLMDFLDDPQMYRLYEKFILEYYRKEIPQITANPERIPWCLEEEKNYMLPAMQSDITLRQGNKVLIIDAKYYSHATQNQFEKHTLHSDNLYQIFTYVKNMEYRLAADKIPHTVSGMLLYAKTDEEIQPEGSYMMHGNRISVTTLDLNQPFAGIRAKLDSIAKDYFHIAP